jgi:hypothetical protein
LTGIGPYFFFINANDEWAQPSSANGYDKDTLVKWTNAQPDEMGQFPGSGLVGASGLCSGRETGCGRAAFA